MKIDREMRSAHARRLVGLLMKHGAGTRARMILHSAIKEIRRRFRGAATPGQILNTAVENSKPLFWIRTSRVGGIPYRVPTPLPDKQAQAIAVRTIVDVARREPGRSMKRRLARAIIAAFRGDVDPYQRWENLWKRQAGENGESAHD